MMKTAHCRGLICVFALIGVPLLCAKDLPAYHAGDAAETDIATPVTLDVIDPTATATLKSAEAMRTPAIFRVCSDTTNALAGEFLAEFAAARSNFIAAVQDTFHQTTLDDTTITAPDFGYLITAFNIKNKKFPVTTGLAAAWARGSPGLAQQKRLLDFLLLTMRHPVRPDALPGNFGIGEVVRLVPVKNPDETVTLTDAETRGQLVTTSSLTTLSQVRVIFQREFTAVDDQPLAHALTMMLQPNCLPDTALTQMARDRAVQQLVVTEHYDAGQIIVRQGSVIDAKTKIALDELNQKLSGLPSQPVTVSHEDAPSGLLPLPSAGEPPPDVAPSKPELTGSLPNPALNIRMRHNLPFTALSFISILALLLSWWLARRRRRASLIPVPASNMLSQNTVPLHAELAPHLAKVVREAVVQELALQRRELLVAQQIAIAEIVGLVQQLDKLHLTMQERAQTYEKQIQKLESELAVRTQENQMLLKLKIEMVRQQLEVERIRDRVEFN